MKVLVAEDEALVRAMAVSGLKRAGYEAIEARDGLQALQFLAEGLKPDALITDIQMPGADGWDVARAFRGRFPTLPILYVTGFADQRKLVPGGVLIQKPYRMSQVLPVLRSLLSPEPYNDAGAA